MADTSQELKEAQKRIAGLEKAITDALFDAKDGRGAAHDAMTYADSAYREFERVISHLEEPE
jgi:hypothetical protein